VIGSITSIALCRSRMELTTMARAGNANEATARRLKIIRLAEGFMQSSDFARDIGLEPARLHNMESGRRPLTVSVAHAVRARTGVTLDWLYHGCEAALAPELLDRLRAAEIIINGAPATTCDLRVQEAVN
jgi:transcriptional regulator with XRE-family HTH domain